MMLASSPLRVEYARCNNVFRISCLPRCLWASCLCSPARHGRGDEMAGCLLFPTAENLRKFRDVTSIAILDYCESELFLIFVVTGVEKELIVLKKRIQVINIYIYLSLCIFFLISNENYDLVSFVRCNRKKFLLKISLRNISRLNIEQVI